MTDIEFLHKHDIDNGRIASRYIQVLRMMHNFINIKHISGSVIVDDTMLKTAIYDYFVDIARINELFVSTFLMISIIKEKEISEKRDQILKDFQLFMLYNLKYRLVTQQSLELMIEAFCCGYDFRA